MNGYYYCIVMGYTTCETERKRELDWINLKLEAYPGRNYLVFDFFFSFSFFLCNFVINFFCLLFACLLACLGGISRRGWWWWFFLFASLNRAYVLYIVL